MLKLCKVLMFGVVLVITSHLKAPVFAADKTVATTATTPATPTVATPPTTLAYEGKVIVVDRAAKTVTVEIQKRLYLFKFGANATVMRKGKRVRMEDILAGQDITLQLVQKSDGEVLVAGIDITTSTTEAEPAGKSTPSSTAPPSISQPGYAPAWGGLGAPSRPTVSPYN